MTRRIDVRFALCFLLGWSLAPMGGTSVSAQPASTQQLLDRAVAAFEQARIAESVAAFDELVKLRPDLAPRLWQRGIALYYARRFADCRAQFESHRTVNPNDVENAAWHFACVARAESPRAAKEALLPVGPDSRRPMREVYQMFQGALTPDQVLAAAGSALDAQFYAHLYVGLYDEAVGDDRGALRELTTAADERFAPPGGYMHMVARVHIRLLRDKR
jgi:lipoprotein NlpI